MSRGSYNKRSRESGVTILLVAIAMFAILAMAALAVDIVTLYVARTEAQRAADTAALAGAKALVLSGFTSGQLGDPKQSTTLSNVCTSGAPGSLLVDQQVTQAAAQNKIEGNTATVTNMSCAVDATGGNPRVSVTIQQTNLPTFFAKIFGQRSASVSATASAEAFNDSGSTVPLQVGSAKPWLIPNCQPGTAPPCTGAPNYFIDTTNNYALNTPSNYVGQAYTFVQPGSTVGAQQQLYYPADLPTVASVCPSPGHACTAGNADYCSNVTCANPTNQLSCGTLVSVDAGGGSPQMKGDTADAVVTLIHASGAGGGNGQDQINPSGVGTPVTIDGGNRNPNSHLRNVPNISRSDSVVSVPVYDGQTNLCPSPGSCVAPQQKIIGFLQLGIQQVRNDGDIVAVIMNAVGCNPNNGGNNVVTGGGISAVPVRLVQ